MKITFASILVTVALLSEYHFKSAAIPMTKADEMESDRQGMIESLEENDLRSGPGSAKIIVVADSNLLRILKSLDKGVPHHNLIENMLSTEHREVGSDLSSSVAIIKRDTTRCMVGRVYRPCWEV